MYFHGTIQVCTNPMKLLQTIGHCELGVLKNLKLFWWDGAIARNHLHIYLWWASLYKWLTFTLIQGDNEGNCKFSSTLWNTAIIHILSKGRVGILLSRLFIRLSIMLSPPKPLNRIKLNLICMLVTWIWSARAHWFLALNSRMGSYVKYTKILG